MKKANVGVNTAVALVLVMVIFSTRVCGTVAVVRLGVEDGGMPISGVWSMDPACPAAVIPVHSDPLRFPRVLAKTDRNALTWDSNIN